MFNGSIESAVASAAPTVTIVADHSKIAFTFSFFIQLLYRILQLKTSTFWMEKTPVDTGV
jgi:hypothetical protein